MADQDDDKGPGEPEDAVDAVVKGALTWPDAPAGDPNVCKAFLIGWRLALLAGPDEDIGGFGLGAEAFKPVLHEQIEGAAKELLGDKAPPLDAGPVDAMVRALVVKDPVLARACRLGVDLQRFCAGTAAEGVTVGALRDQTAVLATKFPPYAAHSVINSLTLYEGVSPKPAAELKGQGDLWRPILAGEVAAKDVLHLSDYVGTGAAVAGRIGEVARYAFRSRLVLLPIAALVLFAAGILLLVSQDGTGDDLAGVSSVLAAFGLTWKGIGASIGRAAANAEKSLWDSQLNWAIAYRATVPFDATDNKTTPAGRHRRAWKLWLKKWPDFDGKS
jgi:hypothetical protein